MLEYKSKEKGKSYIFQVVKYVHIMEQKQKSQIREWISYNCSSINDRDINASINIMFEGLKYCFDR